MITIRPLTVEDIPVLRELAIRIYRETFSHNNTAENMEAFLATDYSLESFRSEFAEDGSLYFFAEEAGVPVGYLRLRKSTEAESLLGSNTIELHRLYIDPAHQGKRIGTILMEYALELAKGMGVDWIWLGVWEKNPKAQKFYDHWGFERFSQHVFQMGQEAQIDWLLKKRVRN